jgi:hypothetical protein
MRIAGSIIAAICGIVVIVSIFLPWFDMGIGSMGQMSAWDGIDASVGDFRYFLLVMIGGILMAVFGISAFIVSLASKGGRAAVLTLGLFALVGAFLAIGGSVWFLVDYFADPTWAQWGMSAWDFLGYGVWIALVGSIIGFIFAILTAAFAKGKGDW